MTHWNNLSRKDAKRLGIEGEYELMQLEKKKESKYHNKKTDFDNITFDSQKEANYYAKIKMALENGDIKKFETQVKYRLQDGFDDKEGNHHRPINYYADFRVWWTNGLIEVIDTKGCRTDVYKIKKKLLLKKYPEINFREM